uniref:Uncharacterized protein n=1 Tax=Chrysotila carterae TaxID=13221 RepID=A0A7S4EW86_CHRCT
MFTRAATSLRTGVGRAPQPAPQLKRNPNSALNTAVAASLALLLSGANPQMTSADVPAPAVVQQYGASMIAGDEDLRPAQQKYLEERAKMKQQYEAQVEGTFKDSEETADKKGIYVTIVGGLVLVAFVAPMVSYFYYTGGK